MENNSAPIPPATLSELRDFYAAIPDEQWRTGGLGGNGRHCAIGHWCKAADLSTEAATDGLYEAFGAAFPQFGDAGYALYAANDGNGHWKQYGDTPKARVLAYLDSLLAGGAA
jgi:hypothetical protein